MDGADEDAWSGVAADWAALWGGFSDPARRAIIAGAGIGPGSRVLDVGCGSGEFLAMLHSVGAVAAGIDPAPRMIDAARSLAPDADVRLGAAESLPWGHDSFDVVTAVNAIQFADDTLAALAEAARVTVPGGRIAISNWAEGARNDLDVLERAVAEAAGEELRPDGDLRQEGGLEELLTEGGLTVLEAGIVEMPWEAPDDATLVRGVLMGEDADVIDEATPVLLAAARRFRTESGGYRLVNAFRYAIGRTPG